MQETIKKWIGVIIQIIRRTIGPLASALGFGNPEDWDELVTLLLEIGGIILAIWGNYDVVKALVIRIRDLVIKISKRNDNE